MNNPDQSGLNFLDDSILFSQKSNWDPHDVPDISNPITPNAKLNRMDDTFPHQAMTNNFTGEFDHGQASDKVANLINYTNHTLKSFGFSQLGNLLTVSDEQIQQTLNTVQELVQQRMRDIDFRNEMFEKMAKVEHDKSMFMQNIERLKQENLSLSKEVGRNKNQIAKLEQNFKKEKEKLSSENTALAKNMTKLTQKNTQYQHEIKKKEAEAARMKDQMLKKTVTANQRYVAELSKNGRTEEFKKNVTLNAETELNNIMGFAADTYRNKLLEENEDLRRIVHNVYIELVNMVDEKKEAFISTRAKESSAKPDHIKDFYNKYFENAEMLKIKTGVFQMPWEKVGSEVNSLFRENMGILREFLDKVCTFSFSTDTFKDLSKELSEIDDSRSVLSEFQEVKNAIEKFKRKTQPNTSEGLQSSISKFNSQHFVSEKENVRSAQNQQSTSKNGSVMNRYNMKKDAMKKNKKPEGLSPSAKKLQLKTMMEDFLTAQEGDMSQDNLSDISGLTLIKKDDPLSISEIEKKFNKAVKQTKQDEKTQKEKEKKNELKKEINKWQLALQDKPNRSIVEQIKSNNKRNGEPDFSPEDASPIHKSQLDSPYEKSKVISKFEHQPSASKHNEHTNVIKESLTEFMDKLNKDCQDIFPRGASYGGDEEDKSNLDDLLSGPTKKFDSRIRRDDEGNYREETLRKGQTDIEFDIMQHLENKENKGENDE